MGNSFLLYGARSWKAVCPSSVFTRRVLRVSQSWDLLWWNVVLNLSKTHFVFSVVSKCLRVLQRKFQADCGGICVTLKFNNVLCLSLFCFNLLKRCRLDASCVWKWRSHYNNTLTGQSCSISLIDGLHFMISLINIFNLQCGTCDITACFGVQYERI